MELHGRSGRRSHRRLRWQPGFLRGLGALDFAGGTVVHISAGVSALVCALVLGKRLGFGQERLEPHDATMVVLGAGLLWFGWFGFNAGSALAAGSLSTSAFVVTQLATAMASVTWMTVSWLHKGSPSVLGAAAGAVAGLVAITPASGYVAPAGALLIGLGAGVICYAAVTWIKHAVGVDDALDVWGVHGVGGIWGAVATGIFATTAVNAAGPNGLLYGNPSQLLYQLVAVLVSAVYAGAATWVILKLLDVTIGLRVPREQELAGLDASIHGEPAYAVEIYIRGEVLGDRAITATAQDEREDVAQLGTGWRAGREGRVGRQSTAPIVRCPPSPPPTPQRVHLHCRDLLEITAW